MTDEITPATLEAELGVDAKRIRAYLREAYPKPLWTRWELSDEQADDVRGHFTTA